MKQMPHKRLQVTFNTATLRPGTESKTRGNALTSARLDTNMEAVGIVPLLALILLPFDCHVCCICAELEYMLTSTVEAAFWIDILTRRGIVAATIESVKHVHTHVTCCV